MFKFKNEKRSYSNFKNSCRKKSDIKIKRYIEIRKSHVEMKKSHVKMVKKLYNKKGHIQISIQIKIL